MVHMTAVSKNNVMEGKIVPTHSTILSLDVARRGVVLAFWFTNRMRENPQSV
jgi:hypothetical protein